ncbi:armadillo-type protein, partial [Fomitopsis serialis]|uniref:armadillo-type protein n=1 Tax=Fomitopsis serialis TaxID=139415 RepID=UPI002008993B
CLAIIGIHKNGTWAAHKTIECAQTLDEVALVTQNLRPYVPPLLLDQFGNYVVQCCLRFGAPATNFVFDAMVGRLWEIAQGRFGARSMRACLESSNITASQQRRITTAIILNLIPLATNPNGALLLTWLLGTPNFPLR